jgi:hypothetical protein
MADPTYFDDFWTKPGYLGANASSDIHTAVCEATVTVVRMIHESEAVQIGLMRARDKAAASGVDHAFESNDFSQDRLVGFQISPTLHNQPLGVEATALNGEYQGITFNMDSMREGIVLFGNDIIGKPPVFAEGTQLSLSNKGYLAMQTYHRHQVPPQSEGFHAWDQFRDDHGNPKYPQRPVLLGPLFVNSTGCQENGTVHGKMILVPSLLDREAFPWQADWYKNKVLSVNKDADIRLWYSDNALHADEENQEDPSHTVSYLGMLQEALLQVSAWAERSIEPAANSSYTIEDNQVIMDAARRGGIQPTIRLSVEGKDSATIKTGQTVNVEIDATTPASASHDSPLINQYAWDVDGSGRFSVKEATNPTKALHIGHECSFDAPGEYYVAARISAQRSSFAGTDFDRLDNVARVRIIVEQ